MLFEFRPGQKMHKDSLQLFRERISIWLILRHFLLMVKSYPDIHVFIRHLISGKKTSGHWGGEGPGIETGTDRLLEPGTKPLG